MRVIIRCAGDATRWNNYRGFPKHLIPLAGEPILHRTVRLIDEIAPGAEIKVVVKDLSDKRYLVPPSSRTVDKPTPENGDLDKIASTRHLWASDRTVLLWGDTWWTRDALTDVLAADLDTWHSWLRVGPGGNGGELFAFAWPGTANADVSDALDSALAAHHAGDLAHAGHLGYAVRGGWALLRSLCGLPWAKHGPYRNTTRVDDWTEDMDTSCDWDRWCLRWAETDEAKREEMIR